MRRAASTDSNQSSIVSFARKLGFTVEDASKLGGGFPDIVLGRSGFTFLAEIKDPAKPPSKRRLTPDQIEWHEKWRGHKCILETDEDVIRLHEYALKLAKLPSAHADGTEPRITAAPRHHREEMEV